MNDASAWMRNVLPWGIPFVAVIAALGYETDWGRAVSHDAPAVSKAPPQPVTVVLLPEYRIDGGVEARKETVDRVLFNPTRRPAPPATQTAGGPSSMQKGRYTLTGTTVSGGTATAFLREVKDGKARSVRKGDTLDGMLVADVKPDHVRLKQGDEFEELQLKIASGPKATIQTATAPPPGQPVAQGNALERESAAARRAARQSGQGAVAPPPATAAAPPGTEPRQGGTPSVSELLAERRRAARAAAAANAQATPAQPPRARAQ